MKKFLLPLFIITFSYCSAQFKPEQFRKFVFINIEYRDLYSTHDTQFKGPGIEINKPVSKHLLIGIGSELAKSSIHNDNGLVLNDIQFIPIFFNEQLLFKNFHKMQPYIHAAEGVSFNSYKQFLPERPLEINSVHENGIYLYAGGGINYQISQLIALTAEIGMKSFNTSFNNLDINPHGIAGKTGIVIHFSKKS